MTVSVNRCGGVDIKDVLSKTSVAHIPNAEKTLDECMRRSVEVRCGMIDDEVACIWGLIPPTLLSNRAYLWLLTTDIVAEHKFLFVRYSQRYVEQMLQKYPEIYGEVHIDNHNAKRWLRWLGAILEKPSGDLIPFTIKRKALNG